MGEGFLLCNEIHPKRAKILSGNIERMGIANALVTNESPDRLAQHLPEYFDRVLIDAPCSGEGMFRKEEAAVTDWSPETVEMCARRQAEILDAGAALVRPGGRLVYSTCTFAPQENEQAVAEFLERNPDFEPETISAPWFTPAGEGHFRMWPHKLLGEGQFGAVLRRKGEQPAAGVGASGEKLPKLWEDFAKQLGIHLPSGKAVAFGSHIFWAPMDMPALKGLKVLRPGLELGELKKDRFEPAHALALWLRSCNCMENIAADSRQIQDYLCGNVIASNKKGWCLVTVDGYPIGWGKGDGIQLKNHYPKGLRRFR